MLVTSGGKLLALSCAVFLSAKLAMLGEESAPNKWTVMRNSVGASSTSPCGHHKKHKKSVSLSVTLTSWNIACYWLLSEPCQHCLPDLGLGVVQSLEMFPEMIHHTQTLLWWSSSLGDIPHHEVYTRLSHQNCSPVLGGPLQHSPCE